MKYFVGFVLVRSFLFILYLMPFSIGERLAWVFGNLTYFFLPSRRKIAYQHLSLVFRQEKSEKEIRKIIKKYYFNIFLSLLEFAHLPKWNQKEFEKRIILEGIEHFQKANKKGKGVIGISAHFGNFFLGLCAWSLLLMPVSFVIKMRKNPRLNKLLLEYLCRFGNKPINRIASFPELERSLKEGNGVCLMIDQRGGKGFSLTPVHLFGKIFYLNKGPALLSAKTDAPIIPIYTFRLKDGRHRIVLGEEVPMVKTQDPQNDIQVNMDRIIATFESAAKIAPDHWLYWAWRGFQKDFKNL